MALTGRSIPRHSEESYYGYGGKLLSMPGVSDPSHSTRFTVAGSLCALDPCPFGSSRCECALAKIGRGERIRTSGPCLPKTVLYQAELLPDRNPLEVRHGRSGSQGRG